MQHKRIKLFGIVQGVGFRPFTHLAADANHIRGTVANKGSYVEIFAKGEPQDMENFIKALSENAPDRASVLKVRAKDTDPFEADDFKIIESEKEYGDIFVSPDIATCDKCREELFDKTNRRYLHPFINCTQCGPRVTILDSMPYDRERTSMKKFPMCPECEEEYTSPLSRRYDAQPVCCNKCGPEVYIIGTDLKGADAITAARRAIMDGKVVAVKGIGGFHLACDARNDSAVARLRELKHRPMKPLAIMLKNIETAEQECEITEVQRDMLTGWQKPIVLLRKKDGTKLSSLLAPDNPTVGVMLPYAPVQMLLFDYPDDIEMTDALVMTSGNVSGAPISRCDEDALSEIASFTDLMLSHNRDIRLRADDSVMDYIYGRPYMIRRSRGFAPLPVMTSKGFDKQILAIGGELKNTFCIAKGDLMYLSPYVGDMGDIRTVNALTEAVTRMTELLEAEPEMIVADLHPRYNTGAVAEELAKERNIPLVRIQHHYAHILSCMAENDFDGKVIGLSYDGTGYGEDGTIWGGEILICDRSGYERAGHIEPFMQVGGDISSKEGWRIAVQLIRNAFGNSAGDGAVTTDIGEETAVRLGICTPQEYKLSCKMADAGINSVKSTSCGRLFDGVSAILGIRRASTFEGEASIALMYKAMEFEESSSENELKTLKRNVAEKFNSENGTDLSTGRLVKWIVEEFEKGESVEKLAYMFHEGLAEMSARAVKHISGECGIMTAALSGGVFQNTLLTRLVKEKLENEGITVLLHSEVPPNDGGIALGQAYYKKI